jgi:hypothetical protein
MNPIEYSLMRKTEGMVFPKESRSLVFREDVRKEYQRARMPGQWVKVAEKNI